MTSQARWGLPDWTKPGDYPSEATDYQWRWEFLRRRPDYREEWDQWEGFFQREQEGIVYAITDEPILMELKFGVSVIYDPRQQLDAGKVRHLFNAAEPGVSPVRFSADDIRRGAELAGNPGELEIQIEWRQEMEKACRAAGLTAYHFNIRKPLGPQITKAHEQLLCLQEELHRKENTPRPSRELWPTYLRVLDARDSGTSWPTIGKLLWPDDGGDVKHKARNTHRSAVGVRDNFPL